MNLYLQERLDAEISEIHGQLQERCDAVDELLRDFQTDVIEGKVTEESQVRYAIKEAEELIPKLKDLADEMKALEDSLPWVPEET